MAVVINPDCASIVAHQPGVARTVDEIARRGAAIARGELSSHRDPTDDSVSTIGVETVGTDGYWYLQDSDDGALAIEFGHTAPDGSPVEGIHPIQRSAARL